MSQFNLTIFGGTGDLSYRKLMPAMYNLYIKKELPEDFMITAIGRREYTSEDYHKIVEPWITEFAQVKVKDQALEQFFTHIHYFRMDFTDLSLYQLLDDYYEKNPTSNHVVYYAVSPEFFNVITDGFSSLKNIHEPKIVLEKPFGATLSSAKVLSEKLERLFGKDHVYRIDHYLGKEMVRNILTIREANLLFANVWNKENIDSVEISALEEVGVETRGNYYDHAGALKDMVQNHLLQIMSIVAVDDPHGDINTQQLEVLRHLRPLDQVDIKDTLLKGQYEGYRQEMHIDPASKTETFAALKLFIDTDRWQGVPFYIRTGKKMERREIVVKITFKSLRDDVDPDVLVIKIQPTEGVYLEFNIKTPGEDSITKAQMDFCQNCNLIFKLNTPEAYERMLHACMDGDGSWFSKWELIERSWQYIDTLKQMYIDADLPIYTYPQGSLGPKEADQLYTKK
ncbi:MAG: glucose-6-phosphate dehydrogenase [Erysipelotrichaceae bacterium]|nr:glucose-6-phosphate dehydrogenase [Erysipelotrichaceae bacterium]